MKKSFLFSLLLLVLSAVSISGQVNKLVSAVGTPVSGTSQLVDGTYYVIQQYIYNKKGITYGYLYEDAATNKVYFESSLGNTFKAGEVGNTNFAWKLTIKGSLYFFQNAATGRYLSATTIGKNISTTTTNDSLMLSFLSNSSYTYIYIGSNYLLGNTSKYYLECNANSKKYSNWQYFIHPATLASVQQAFVDAKALIDGMEKVGGYTTNQMANLVAAYNNGANCSDSAAAAALKVVVDSMATLTKISEAEGTIHDRALNYLNNSNRPDNYSTAQLAALKVAYGNGSYDNIVAITAALDTLETTQTKITTEQYNNRKQAAGFLGYPDVVGSYTTAQLASLKATWDADNSFENIAAIQNALDSLKKACAPVAFDNTKTYKLYNPVMRNGYAMFDKNYPNYVSSNFGAGITTDSAAVDTTDATLWQVYKYQGKTYLYSKGAGRFIENTSNSSWPFTDTLTPMMFTQYNDGNAVFYNIKVEGATAKNPYFNMSNPSGFSSTYRGLASWTPSSTIVSGSAWLFVPTKTPADLSIISKLLAKQVVAAYDSTKTDYVGNPTAAEVKSLNTLLADSTASALQIDTLINTMGKSLLKVPDALFRIESAFAFQDSTTKVLFEGKDAKNIAWTTVDSTTVPMLWRFVSNADGTYRIQSANTKKEIGTLTAAGPTMKTEGKGSSFSLQSLGSLQYALVATDSTGGNTLALYNDSTVASKSDSCGNQIGIYNSTTGAYPTLFRIHLAKSISLAVSDAGYTTTWFPFAVKVPAEVTLSGVTETSGALAVLKDLKDSTLSAATPVLVKAPKGVYTFYFSADSGSVIPGNLLIGTNAPTAVADSMTYVMALTSTNVPAFCLAGALTIPANKAYLLKSSLSKRSQTHTALTFSYVPDAIQAPTLNNGKAPIYYDLFGRRVLRPSRGIFIENGKKVIIR